MGQAYCTHTRSAYAEGLCILRGKAPLPILCFQYLWKGITMFSIAEFLDRAKARASIDTDYRLGKVIGISHQVISGYRLGKSLPNESVIEQLCALSGDDPDFIAAQIQAARAKDAPARVMWSRIAARLAGGASTAILSVLFSIGLIAGTTQDAMASSLTDLQNAESQQFIHRIKYVFVSGCIRLERLRHTLKGLPGFLRLCWLSVC